MFAEDCTDSSSNFSAQLPQCLDKLLEQHVMNVAQLIEAEELLIRLVLKPG